MAYTLRDRLFAAIRLIERYTRTDMHYVLRGGFWLAVGQVGSLVLSFALAVAFGHFAAQETYGNYKYILGFASLLNVVSLSGLGIAVSRSAARGHEGVLEQGFGISMRYAIPLVCCGLLASAYYTFISRNEFAAAGLFIASIVLPFINGFSLSDSFLTGIRDFRRSALFALGSLALQVGAVAATLLFVSQRAIVLVIVYFAATLLTDALWYARSRRLARNRERDPDLLRYGFHLSAMNVVAFVADRIDSVIVFSLLGPVDLAVYSYAIAMPEALKGLAKGATPLSMPKFANRTIAEIRTTIWPRIAMFVTGLYAVVALYALAAPFIFKTFFPVYESSVLYSQFYAFCVPFTGVSAILSSILQAHKNTKGLYVTRNVGPAALIVTLPILTHFWGIAGAIAAQFVYRAVVMFAAVLEFKKMAD